MFNRDAEDLRSGPGAREWRRAGCNLGSADAYPQAALLPGRPRLDGADTGSLRRARPTDSLV